MNVSVILVYVVYSNVPVQAQGPKQYTGIQQPSVNIDVLVCCHFSSNNHSVGQDKGEVPSHINVAIVLLVLA